MSNEEEANYVRKLKRGQGKYKGTLPFKWFNVVGLETLLQSVHIKKKKEVKVKKKQNTNNEGISTIKTKLGIEINF